MPLIVSFLRMKLFFLGKETNSYSNETLLFEEKHYLCRQIANDNDNNMNRDYTIPMFTPADMVGAFIIIMLVVGIFTLMWIDYKRYLDEQATKYRRKEKVGFKIEEFIKTEQLYIFLFLMFLFLIGGEILLYNKM